MNNSDKKINDNSLENIEGLIYSRMFVPGLIAILLAAGLFIIVTFVIPVFTHK